MIDRAHPVQILLVEDNATDVLIAREALKEANVPNRLYVVDNGESAVDFLQKTGLYTNVPTPNLVLLDLNIPRKSGREVLTEIKADETLRHIPIIILTTSQNEDDILYAYQNFANSYVTKPLSFREFQEVLQAIENFWMHYVHFPRRPE
jgi:chemotaxis family two-component system response regulator Rcp1